MNPKLELLKIRILLFLAKVLVTSSVQFRDQYMGEYEQLKAEVDAQVEFHTGKVEPK